MKQQSPWLAYKIRDTKLGLFSGPGVIGGRWTKVGRSWTSKSALSNAIRVWQERVHQRWYHSKGNPADWQVVVLTPRGEICWDFGAWVQCIGTKSLPVPLNNPLMFTADEIDQVEEALRNNIGDADEAGELTMRVVEALKHYEFNSL